MKKKLTIIAGPTAVGKTSLSVQLAEAFHCPIISCDSRQFYKGMDVGTAKPTAEEQKGVPHYFLDFLEPEVEYTAGMFELEALQMIQELHEDSDLVIMVGGSTLYVDAITKGFDDLPKSAELRAQLIQETEESGIEPLLLELQEKDPVYFEEVDRSNAVRVQRALEVIRLSGEPYSKLRKGVQKSRAFDMIKIGLNDDREALYERINHRVDLMLENGLEEEARSLHPKKGLTSLKTVGYQEFFDFFDGKIEREEAIELIKRNSRRYAKRQITWFKRDLEFEWFLPNQFEEVFAHINKMI